MNDGTTRFTCRGQSIKHNMVIKINYDLKKKASQHFYCFLKGCSTFSEYTVVYETNVCKVI
jgi:S-(hydroxymethyl)glutathione dehydrogenase/alcohol dehydrogenase